MSSLSKKPESKNEALEALDFIVNVLKEHERDLDRLINDLGTVTDHLGEAGELNGKVQKIEEKINNLQNDVSGLLNYFSKQQTAIMPQRETQTQLVKQQNQNTPTSTPLSSPVPVQFHSNVPVVLQCKQWEDFQALAGQAQTLSFAFKDAEKQLEVDALIGNQIISYKGEIPKSAFLLKSWLAKQLNIPENRVLEGILTVG
jgi:hypothetical protein